MPIRPSTVLAAARTDIYALVQRFGVANPRIFGSTLYGRDHENSDLDLLVDTLPGTTLFDLGGLQEALESLLGVRVDVRTPGDLPASWRNQVLAQAQPL